MASHVFKVLLIIKINFFNENISRNIYLRPKYIFERLIIYLRSILIYKIIYNFFSTELLNKKYIKK